MERGLQRGPRPGRGHKGGVRGGGAVLQLPACTAPLQQSPHRRGVSERLQLPACAAPLPQCTAQCRRGEGLQLPVCIAPPRPAPLKGLRLPACTAPGHALRGLEGAGAGAMRLSAVLAAARLPPGYRHGTWPPDTAAAQRRNPPGQRRRRVLVEPIDSEDWKVFQGDTVQVLSGKDAGKQAMVTQVVRARNWVVVEGLNTHYRYINRTAKYAGTYIASEAPLLLSQIALVDPEDRKPTEVQWRYTEEGERVRVSLRSGRIIPVPLQPRRDGIVPEQWIDGPKDTSVEAAMEKTYVPSLKTFEEEIMDAMDIVETRKAKKSYWY